MTFFTSDDTGSAADLGLTVQSLTPEIADQLGVAPGTGVMVTSVVPGSIAALAGIRPRAESCCSQSWTAYNDTLR